MEQYRGTTILCVRRGNMVVIGGDGQVTLGNTVMKGNARKVRRLLRRQVLAGFAGGTADAFTLFERFEGKLDSTPATSPAPPSNSPRTGAPTAACGASKRCWWWPTRTPRS